LKATILVFLISSPALDQLVLRLSVEVRIVGIEEIDDGDDNFDDVDVG